MHRLLGRIAKRIIPHICWLRHKSLAKHAKHWCAAFIHTLHKHGPASSNITHTARVRTISFWSRAIAKKTLYTTHSLSLCLVGCPTQCVCILYMYKYAVRAVCIIIYIYIYAAHSKWVTHAVSRFNFTRHTQTHTHRIASRASCANLLIPPHHPERIVRWMIMICCVVARQTHTTHIAQQSMYFLVSIAREM